MRHNYKNLTQKFMGAAALLLLSFNTGKGQVLSTVNFTYTGNVQSFVVPQCVTQVTIEAWGAEGGGVDLSSNTASGYGGKGGYSRGTLAVAAGSTLHVYVGGYGQSSTSGVAAGGWNGGGSGYASSSGEPGNGGGGASDVRVGGQAFSNRVIVAGGGGGGGEDSGDSYGHGGGTSGTGYTGYDATQTSAGTGGGVGFGATTGNGDGGGGGGGYYGGGTFSSSTVGTDTQGGGGGSGYIGGVTNGITIDGASSMPSPVGSSSVTGNAGHGYVRIRYQDGNGMTAIVSPTVICTGNSATLSASSVNSYTWTHNSSTSNSVVVSPTSNSSYTVLGTNASGCTASLVLNVAVNQAVPSLTVANTASVAGGICLGKPATLTASGALTYTWSGGTGTVTNGQQFYPSNTTTYVVTGGNACGTTTAATSISVTPLLVAAATTSTLLCSGTTATLTAFSGVTGYTWQPGNQQSSSYIVSPIANTVYTVTASDGTCAGVATVAISTNPIPTINVVVTTTNICLGDAVSLSANGGNNYTWTSVPATSTITGQSTISPSFPTPGAYAFYATGDNNFGCTSSANQVIIVNTGPVLNATATKTLICSGATTTLSAGGGNLYQWDSNANSATTPSTVVSPTVTTVYNVTGTLNSTGCSATSSVTVYIYNPTLTISSPTSACLGSAVTLTGQVNNPSAGSTNSYTWTVPGQANSNGTSVVVSPTSLIVATLSAKSTTVGNLVCIETKTTSVGISPNPTITVVPSRTFVCRNEPVDLIADGGVSYTWNNNSFSGSTITVTHANIATVTYTVIGTDANGCKNSTIYYLKINGCQGLEELSNSATLGVYPNPSNGEFFVTADADLKLKLINELGQVIRHFEINAANAYKAQITDVSKGLYFIVSDDAQAIAPQKIIVK